MVEFRFRFRLTTKPFASPFVCTSQPRESHRSVGGNAAPRRTGLDGPGHCSQRRACELLWWHRTIRAVTRSEEAALYALVTQLSAALAGLGEPAVPDHPAFSVDADWLPGQSCVTATRSGAAELWFMPEGEWIRVDVAGLDECLELPLPDNRSRAARKRPPMAETLTRLLTSSTTVRYGRHRTDMFLTDAAGRIWCQNRYLPARKPPPGLAWDEPHVYAALFPNKR